jgi:TRAP-type C4-dicarboxylate transport system substrate-binding protein
LLSLTALTGCGSSAASNPAPSTPAESKIIRLAHVSSTDMGDPYHRFAAKFSEFVEKESNGSLEIEVIPGGQLGQENEMFEGMKLGTVDMGVMTNSFVSSYVKEVALFDLPFLFPDYETAHQVLDGPVGQ